VDGTFLRPPIASCVLTPSHTTAVWRTRRFCLTGGHCITAVSCSVPLIARPIEGTQARHSHSPSATLTSRQHVRVGVWVVTHSCGSINLSGDPR